MEEKIYKYLYLDKVALMGLIFYHFINVIHFYTNLNKARTTKMRPASVNRA